MYSKTSVITTWTDKKLKQKIQKRQKQSKIHHSQGVNPEPSKRKCETTSDSLGEQKTYAK